MPTIPNANATEFQASGNVASIANDGMDSSLTSSESDDDDRRESSALSPVLDSSDNIMHENENVIPDAESSEDSTQHPDDPFVEARRNMPDEQRARVERRMNKIKLMPSDQPGESSLHKGKVADPGNWGDVQLDEAEIDPETQQEILTVFNSRRDLQNDPPEQPVPTCP
ncbi:hypothetical protein C0989_008495 [Termitomyces sp. Mn162]|nr:hypothetical protein C0989_008495 [Termitomyces sp. Mn162]